jgi:AraC-like DNA-binding protein
MALSAQFDQLPARPAQAARVARAGLPGSFFHTDRLAPVERFEAWRQSIGVFLDVARPDGDGEAFAASVESYMIDGIMLARCAAGQQMFARPVAKFARDAIDHYMIQLFIAGGFDMRRGGQLIRGGAGNVVAFDCGDVLDSANSDFDLLAIFIPRRRLAPLLRRPDSLHGVCPDPESGAGRMLTGYCLDLYLNAPWLDGRDARVMADTLVTLIAQAMNSAAPRDLSQDDATHAALLRARTHIRQNLARPDLDEAEVAAATGLGVADLRQLFDPVGGLAAFLTEKRLRLAASRLMQAEGASWRQLAVEAGFADLTHFARAFRKRFGCAPQDVWQGTCSMRRMDREALSPLCGDRTYEDWILSLG